MSPTTMDNPRQYRLLKVLENSGDLTIFGVPSPNSGVTGGGGVDWKEMDSLTSEKIEEEYNISTTTGVPMVDAIGLKGKEAEEWIKINQPNISYEDAERMTDWRIAGYSYKLRSSLGITGMGEIMEPEVEEVALSVFYQYGRIERCPSFFGVHKNKENKGIKQYISACLRNDIPAKITLLVAIINELENFGDAYPTRRKKEANHIKLVLKELRQPRLSLNS